MVLEGHLYSDLVHVKERQKIEVGMPLVMRVRSKVQGVFRYRYDDVEEEVRIERRDEYYQRLVQPLDNRRRELEYVFESDEMDGSLELMIETWDGNMSVQFLL